MTTTAEQCIAYRHKRTWHNLISLSLQACFCVSQGSSCCVKPIAVLHLTVDGCTLHIDYITPRATTIDDWLELQGSNMTSLSKYVTCNRLSTVQSSCKPPQHRLNHLSMGPLQISFSKPRPLAPLQWKRSDPICSCLVTIHSRYTQQTTNQSEIKLQVQSESIKCHHQT